MNFNSLEFLLFFLPAVLLLFHAAPQKCRVPILFVASVIFYASSGFIPAVFMLLCIGWAWTTGFILHRHPRWYTTLLAVSFPLSVLFMFRYLDFSLTNLGASVETRQEFDFFLSVLLPAGISFFTFEIASYSFDIARGKITPDRNLLRFSTFVAVFPKLIAGPILRYDELKSQIARLGESEKIGADFPRGLKLLSIGLFCKIFFADVLATISKTYFDSATSQSSLDATYIVVAFSYRIYFDFWSYSIMAIGLGAMLGLSIPRNFLEPYRSASPQEFWRRWHTSLSYWLRDYVYIGIGGNKAYARNIIIVFLACGLWHGAGWNFLAWGAYHAALVLLYRLCRKPWDLMPLTLRVSLTFLLVSLGWPLFYLSIEQYWHLLNLVFSFEFFGGNKIKATHWIYLLIPTFIVFLTREENWLFGTMGDRKLLNSPILHAGMAAAAIFLFQFRETFIYFRF